MGKINARNHIALIFKRKYFLSLTFILLTLGSYTYSEGSKSHTKIPNNNSNSLLISCITFSGIECISVHPGVIPTIKKLSSIKKPTQKPSELIMDTGLISANYLAGFLSSNNSMVDHNYAVKLARLYIEEANSEGVNPDIAFTQMCLETGFLRFDGTVKPSQYNFCGLGVTGRGVQGLTFKDERKGVRAHIQHLKAYASVNKLNNNLVDSRFRFVKRGSVKDITGLTGRWASDKQYDKKIRNLLHRLYSISAS